jgi:hypothetical protein
MMGKAIPIELAELLGRAREDEPPMPLVEAQIEALKEFAAGYMVNPFKVGDLVKTKPTSGIRGEMTKQPQIVVDVRNTPLWSGANETYDSSGCMHPVNIRTAVVMPSGSIACFWNSSHDFEFWVEPKMEVVT